MRSRNSVLAAAAVFAVTFAGWLGMRWYEGARVSADVTGPDDIYYCACTCGATIVRVSEYGETLQPEEGLECVQRIGEQCTGLGETPVLSYANCGIGGLPVQDGVVRPGI